MKKQYKVGEEVVFNKYFHPSTPLIPKFQIEFYNEVTANYPQLLAYKMRTGIGTKEFAEGWPYITISAIAPFDIEVEL